jgi:uncharacterized protein YacL
LYLRTTGVPVDGKSAGIFPLAPRPVRRAFLLVRTKVVFLLKLITMSQTSNTMPPGGLWKLQLADFWKGFVKSCGGLLVGLLINLIQDKFQLPTYEEVQPLLEATVYFFLGYLGINAATNNEGKMFKKDADIVSVSADDLDDLIEENKTNK